MRKGSEDVHVKRKARGDRLKPVSGPEAEFDIEGVHLIPAYALEAEGGYVQIDGLTLVHKGDVDLRPDDVVTARGNDYQIIGKPGKFVKRGKIISVIATLRRTGAS